VIGFGSQKLGSTSALERCIVERSGCAASFEAGLNDLLGSGRSQVVVTVERWERN
jgi:hypothetical protein